MTSDTDTLHPESDSPSTEQAQAGEEGKKGGEGQEENPRLDLVVKVAAKSACERHVTVTVSRADIDRYLEKALSELRGKAEVPGFRPGRAPRKLVESRFRDQVRDQVKGSLLMDSMAQINEDNTFTAISEPSFNIDAVVLPDEGPLTFEFNIEVRPEFEMPEWKGLKINRPVRQVTDTDVAKHLKRVLRRYAVKTPVESAAELHDFLTVNLTASHNGQQLERVEELEIEVATTLDFADAKLENFGSLAVGKMAGDTFTATVTVSPDAVKAELRGQEVSLEFTVLDVKRSVTPELTPKFLESLGGFESEDELKELVRNELERQNKFYQSRAIRQQITEQLTASANWELPPDLLRRQTRREMDRIILELRRSGFADEQIQAHANRLSQNSLESTAKALKEHFIFERIAEDQKVEAVPADYDEEINLIADQSDEPPRRVRARLEKRGLMDTLRNQIIERKVVDLITENATISEQAESGAADANEAESSFSVNVALGGEAVDEAIPEAKHAGGAEEPLPNSPENR